MPCSSVICGVAAAGVAVAVGPAEVPVAWEVHHDVRGIPLVAVEPPTGFVRRMRKEDAIEVIELNERMNLIDLLEHTVASLVEEDLLRMNAADGVIQEAVAIRRGAMTLATGASAEPVEVKVMLSSAGLFRVLGVAPAIGRDFFPGEEGPGRELLVVLGHDIWQGQFGGDSSVIGTEVRLNGNPFTVIGVMGEDFRFVRSGSMGQLQDADVYITLAEDLATTSPGSGRYAGLVRARAGTPPERVAGREAQRDGLDRREAIPLHAQAEAVGAGDAEGESAGGIAENALVKHAVAVQQVVDEALEVRCLRDVHRRAARVVCFG